MSKYTSPSNAHGTCWGRVKGSGNSAGWVPVRMYGKLFSAPEAALIPWVSMLQARFPENEYEIRKAT